VTVSELKPCSRSLATTETLVKSDQVCDKRSR
jgi:hypothetical protein